MAGDGWTAWRARNTLTYVDHELAGEEVPKLDDHSRFLRNPVKDKPCQIVLSLRNLRRLNSFKRTVQARRTRRIAAGNRATWDLRKAKLQSAFEASSARWTCVSTEKASLESDLQSVNTNATLCHRAAELTSRTEIVAIRSQFFSAVRRVTSASSVEIHKAATGSRGSQDPNACQLCDAWGVKLLRVPFDNHELFACSPCNELHSRLFCLAGPAANESASESSTATDLAANALLGIKPSAPALHWHSVFDNSSVAKE